MAQYRGQPRIEALTSVYLGKVQQAEDDVAEIYYGRLLANATGIRLDVIGKLVGEPRLGRLDAAYRTAIGVRVLVNRSQGKGPDIVAILKAATDLPFHVYEPSDGPAAFEVYFEDALIDTDMLPRILGRYMQLAKAAGVNAQLIYPIRPSGVPGSPAIRPFLFSHEGDPTDDTLGFAHAGSTAFGGYLSGVY